MYSVMSTSYKVHMMSNLTVQTIEMLKMLPDDELLTVNSLLKFLLRSWDPDFAKVTPSERDRLEKLEKEMEKGEYYTEEEVW